VALQFVGDLASQVALQVGASRLILGRVARIHLFRHTPVEAGQPQQGFLQARLDSSLQLDGTGLGLLAGDLAGAAQQPTQHFRLRSHGMVQGDIRNVIRQHTGLVGAGETCDIQHNGDKFLSLLIRYISNPEIIDVKLGIGSMRLAFNQLAVVQGQGGRADWLSRELGRQTQVGCLTTTVQQSQHLVEDAAAVD
jgi:hypothetical protein